MGGVQIWPGEVDGGRSSIQELMLNAAIAYFDIKAPSKKPSKPPAPPQVCPHSSFHTFFHPFFHNSFHTLFLKQASQRCLSCSEWVWWWWDQVGLIRRHLISFLCSLVVRHGFVLKANSATEPSLETIASLLHHSALELIATVEERAVMGSKMEEVGELSRHAVEEILTLYAPTTPLAPFHTLRSRRQVAIREMRRAAEGQERQVDTLLYTCEQTLETLYHHFQNPKEDLAGVARRLVVPMEILQTLTKVRAGVVFFGGG